MMQPQTKVKRISSLNHIMVLMAHKLKDGKLFICHSKKNNVFSGTWTSYIKSH